MNHLVGRQSLQEAQLVRSSQMASAKPVASFQTRAPIQVKTPPVEVVALNRMAFGPWPGDVGRVRQMGLPAYIEEQLNPQSITDTDCDTRIANAGFLYLNATVKTLWELDDSDVPWDEVFWSTWTRAIYSKKQLQEVLVDHWHNHFNVYSFLARETERLWPDYHRRIRKNVFGNFRTFLEDIASSPTMLYYLDNYNSERGAPNENYARELFELHTMGVDAYVPGTPAPQPGTTATVYHDSDVYAAARAFAGWTIRNRPWDGDFGDTGEFFYFADFHSQTDLKCVLNTCLAFNQPAMKDAHDVLDLIAYHPATARNVSKRLARRLVADEPSESLIQAGVSAFLANKSKNDQLRHVYRALLTHPDFTSNWGQKVKRPHEAIVSAMRATKAELKFSNDFYYNVRNLGQPLYEWNPPDGYSDKKRVWLSSLRMARRWSFFNYLCLEWLGDSDATTTRVNVMTQMGGALTTPRQIVNFWVDRLLGYRLSDDEMEPLYDFMARGRNLDIALPADEREIERVASLVGLVLATPSTQVR